MSSNSLNKSILKSVILRPLKITKSNMDSICKKILTFGEGILLISENTPIIKIANPKNVDKNKLESVGKTAPGVEIKILDDDGKILSNNQTGEIFIKGDHVIKNYWNNSKADKSIENGWLKTGDLGYFDSDEFLFLKSRKDDLINVSGEKFTPQEVELVIKEIPEISDVAVIGVPHELFGQLPVAFVVTNNKITSTQIINHCGKKLERYKIPNKILFLDIIPKTDSGKIKRNILKSKFAK